MNKVIIIGSGPAGISAALYLKRAGIDVIVFTTNNSALHKAHEIENFYGFKSISGKELYDNGIEQAKNLNIEVIEEEVISLEYNDNYKVITDENTYESKVVILATGLNRKALIIKNIKEYEGKGISYCATCDGFFYINKKVGIIGNGKYAIEEINYLKKLTNDLILFTNGESANELKNNFNYPIYDKKIIEVKGNQKIEKIILEDNVEVNIDGLFVAIGTANGIDFAKKLGVIQENNKIIVDENKQTNIPGLYAIGDLIGGLLQISKAASDGAIVSKSVIKYLNTIKG